MPCVEFTVTGGDVQAADFDRRGKRMLTSGWFGDLNLWDLATLETVGGITFPGEDVLAIALHPDGWLAGLLIGPAAPSDLAEIRLVNLVQGRLLDRRTVDRAA